MIANQSGNSRFIKSFLLAFLIVAEIVLGLLIALRPDDSFLILGAVAGILVVTVTFIKPIVGLYLFVITIFTEALLLLGSISVTKLMGILLFGVWIFHSLSKKHFELIVPRQGWFMAMFIVWGLVSAMWATDMAKLFTALLLLLQSIILYLVMVNLLKTAQQIQIVLIIIVTVNLLLALVSMAMLLSGEFVEGAVDLGQISVGDVNAQAAYFLPGLMLLMVLFSHQSRLMLKALLLLCLAIVTLAILATFSRSALLALVVILAIGLRMDNKLWQVALPALLMVGVAILFLWPISSQQWESIFTLSDRGAGRGDIWLVALQIIRANPILGVGLDNFGRAFDRYLAETPGILTNIGRGRGSHNVLLNVQSELGIIGLSLFVTFIGLTLRRGWEAVMNFKQADDTRMAAWTTAIWLSLVGMLIMGLFIDLQYWKLFWLLLALPEAIRRISTTPLQKGQSRESINFVPHVSL